MEQRVHRRERHHIDQRGPLNPGLIGPVVMSHAERCNFDLRIGRVTDFWIEQVMVPRTDRGLLESVIVAPSAPHTRS